MRMLMLPILLVVGGLAFVIVGLTQPPPDASGQHVVPIDLPSALPTASGGGAVLSATTRPAATIVPARRATRIVINALGIDLAVISQPGGPNSYPPCDVAMYIAGMSSPGYGGVTYIYAHARDGMFLPLLEAVNDGKSLIGMTVGLYTSDDRYYTYKVATVHRHVATMGPALAARAEQLWLQTSEGPHGTVGKLEIVADPVSSRPVSPLQAHPIPHPVDCS